MGETEQNNALIAWAAAASGLAFLWADQDAPRPAYPYGTLKVISDGNAGGTDEIAYTETSGEGVAPGEEMVPTATGDRQITVSCQAFSLSQAAATTARHYLNKLRDSLALPSVCDLLRTNGGLAVAHADSYIPLDDVVGESNRSRGSMDVHFNAVSSIVDTAGISYIEKVKAMGLVSGCTTTAPLWIPDYAYKVGIYCLNVGNIYQCITAGTSAHTGGPTGTAANITDGTAHWKYICAAEDLGVAILQGEYGA